MPEPKQSRKLQSIDSAKNRAYKRVPSALTPEQRIEAVQAFRAGRNLHQISCELSCSPWVVMELWARSEMRRAA